MKRSLLLMVITLCSLISATKILAQPTGVDTVLPRIIFTNSDRLAIFAKTVGVAKLDTLFTSKGTLKVKNLAVLASTKNGQSLLIGGKAVYINQVNALDSIWFIARLNSPFKNDGTVGTFPTFTIGGAKVLLTFSQDDALNVMHFSKMLPIGTLTPDEQSWYLTPSKNSAGNGSQWFFHGRFDGSGKVDSLLVDASVPATATAAAINGYQMTNICSSGDGGTMLTVVIDNTGGDKPRIQLFSWQPNAGGGSFAFLPTDFTGALQGLRPNWIIDSSFAFSMHVDGSNPPNCQLALQPNLKGDIIFYDFRASGSISSLNPDANLRITRNTLPGGLQFFTGYTGNTKDADDDKEVISPEKGYPVGNGGDMMFSPSGDSIVFNTCSPTATATAAESGIYIYVFGTSQLTLIQNDPLKMERQPIFTASVVHKYVPPPPPPYKVGTASLDQSSLDFGTNLIGDPPSKMTVKLAPNNNSLVYVTQATISGADQSNFTMTLNPSLPATISVFGTNKSYSFPITFTPNAARTFNAVLTVHYQDSLKGASDDSVLTVQLTGVGQSKGGVAINSAPSFDLSIAPNPFTSSTNITVTALEAGPSSLEIRDLLGKDIYSSKTLTLGAGEKFSYMLDANALHLVPGTYFVIVRSSGDEITRKAIYIK